MMIEAIETTSDGTPASVRVTIQMERSEVAAILGNVSFLERTPNIAGPAKVAFEEAVAKDQVREAAKLKKRVRDVFSSPHSMVSEQYVDKEGEPIRARARPSEISRPFAALLLADLKHSLAMAFSG